MAERIGIGIFLAIGFGTAMFLAVATAGANWFGDYRRGIGPLSGVLVYGSVILGFCWPWIMDRAIRRKEAEHSKRQEQHGS